MLCLARSCSAAGRAMLVATSHQGLHNRQVESCWWWPRPLLWPGGRWRPGASVEVVRGDKVSAEAAA